MKIGKKILIYSLISGFFFIWGGITSYYKFFPYNVIKFLKDNTYDKILNKETFFEGVTRQSTHEFRKFYEKFPNIVRKKPFIVKYNTGTNIWLDRFYYNHENDYKLLNFYLVKISRHAKGNLSIKLMKDAEIYRAICEINDNHKYRDWDEANFTVVIIGKSCVHNKVIKKKFKKGNITLKAGGPISSDPIFILDNIDIKYIKLK